MPVWQINDGAGVTGNIGSRSGSGPLATTDDQDTYYFQANAGDMLTASAPGFLVDLHDLTGNQLVEGNGDFTWTFTEDGDYWIHVYQSKGDYTLNLDLATGEDLGGSDASLDYYKFTPQAGEEIRLVGDTLVSQASVQLQLLDMSGTLLATSTPIAAADAFLQYTVTSTDPLVVRTTVISTAEGDQPIDYGIVVLGGALYDLEPNSSLAQPQALPQDPQDDVVILGQLGLATTNVLWVGSSTDNWSDDNFQIDTVALADLPADLSPYEAIYLDSNAGIPDTGQAASIAAFVSAGGGLVTENGGDEFAADFSWVPNAGDGFTSQALGSSTSQGLEDDIVQLTAAGHVHPVTASIPDAHLSNWAVALHNVFPETGTMTALAENGAGIAALLAGSHGQGRLAYLGMDASGHQTKQDFPRLIRQTIAWAGNPGPEVDVYSIELASSDQLDLSLTKPSNSSGEYVNEWTDVLRLVAPGGGEVAAGAGALTHVASASGTYLIEVSSADEVGGDYTLAVGLNQAPPQPGVIVTPTVGLKTTEAGGQDQFTVVLATDPGAQVTIPLSSSDEGEGTVSPSEVVFDSSNWSVPQTITVTGVDDAIEDGDQAYTIITGPATSSSPDYTGFDPANVIVTNLDDDGVLAAVTVDTITPNAMGVNNSVNVVITGASFENGATVSLENGTGPAPSVSGVTVVSSGEIHATITTNGKGPNKDRVWDVRVTNPGGATGVLVQAFTVSPSISSLALAAIISDSTLTPAGAGAETAEVLPSRVDPSVRAKALVFDALAEAQSSFRTAYLSDLNTSNVIIGPRETAGNEPALTLASDAVFESELSLADVFSISV